MSIVERYHDPVQRAFHIIQHAWPDTNPEADLQMAVKSFNDSAGLEENNLKLAVYGGLPRIGLTRHRLTRHRPTLSTHKQAIGVKMATNELPERFASRKVRNEIQTKNGLNVADIWSGPIGSDALVYRIERDRWEEPFTILDIEGNEVHLLHPHGPSKFRFTVVKPYIAPMDDIADIHTSAPMHQPASIHQENTTTESTKMIARIPKTDAAEAKNSTMKSLSLWPNSYIIITPMKTQSPMQLVWPNRQTTSYTLLPGMPRYLDFLGVNSNLLFRGKKPKNIFFTKVASLTSWKTRVYPLHSKNLDIR